MEIRQLRAFVAIAESGTFTAGALRVHVTQAAISRRANGMANSPERLSGGQHYRHRYGVDVCHPSLRARQCGQQRVPEIQ